VAGPTTARRGAGQQQDDPARPPRPTRRRLLIVITVGVLLLAAGSVWALYGSSWFRAEQVTTTGVDVLTPAEVEDAAAVPIGAPMVSVDTAAIADRLRQKLPRIDSVASDLK
jgi:cell division protein FtsQ